MKGHVCVLLLLSLLLLSTIANLSLAVPIKENTSKLLANSAPKITIEASAGTTFDPNETYIVTFESAATCASVTVDSAATSLTCFFSNNAALLVGDILKAKVGTSTVPSTDEFVQIATVVAAPAITEDLNKEIPAVAPYVDISSSPSAGPFNSTYVYTVEFDTTEANVSCVSVSILSEDPTKLRCYLAPGLLQVDDVLRATVYANDGPSNQAQIAMANEAPWLYESTTKITASTTQIVINGVGFDTNATYTVAFSNPTLVCASVSVPTANQLTCELEPGFSLVVAAESDIYANVTTALATSNTQRVATVDITYTAPVVTETNVIVSRAATELQISGSFDTRVSSADYSIEFSGPASRHPTDPLSCSAISVSSTTLTCTVSGTLASGALNAIVVMFKDNCAATLDSGDSKMIATIVAAPIITSQDSTNKIGHTATSLTIMGSFDTTVSSVNYSVALSGAPAGVSVSCTPTSISADKIQCQLSGSLIPADTPLEATVIMFMGETYQMQSSTVPVAKVLLVPTLIEAEPIAVSAKNLRIFADLPAVNEPLSAYSLVLTQTSGATTVHPTCVITSVANDYVNCTSLSGLVTGPLTAQLFLYGATTPAVLVTTVVADLITKPVTMSPTSGTLIVGSTITISFQSVVALYPRKCTINGQSITSGKIAFENPSGTTYNLVYTVGKTDPSVTGALAVACEFVDEIGNTASIAQADLPANTIIVDTNVPVISDVQLSPSSGSVNVGSNVTINFSSTLTVAIEACTVNGVPVKLEAPTSSSEPYSIVYTVGSGDSDWEAGSLRINCTLKTAAGNTATISALPANTLSGDANVPTLSSLVLSPSTGVAKIGSEITISFTSSECITIRQCKIAGAIDIPVSSLAASSTPATPPSKAYTITYVVADGSPSWSAGEFDLQCTLEDLAGNAVTIYETDFANNTLAVDATFPSVGPVTLTPSSEYVKIGDTVEISFDSVEVLSLGACAINGKSISSFSSTSPSYVISYQVASGDADWSSGLLPFVCSVQDAAGNEVKLTLPTNTLSGDAHAPTLSSVNLMPMSGSAAVGSDVVVSFVASETLRMVTCTANGVALPDKALAVFNSSAAAPPAKAYSVTYKVSEGDSDWSAGMFSISCLLEDDAGNTVTLENANLPNNTLQGDANTPVLSAFSLTPSSGWVKVGDTVSISFEASSTITLAACTVNRVSVASLETLYNTTYQLNYTVAIGDADWAAGSLPVKCAVSDAAGNVRSFTTADLPDNSLAGDATFPTFTAFGLSPSATTAKVGTPILVTFTSSEYVVMSSCSINGGAALPSSSFFVTESAAAIHNTILYQVAEGDVDWDAGDFDILCQLQDKAGNVKTISKADLPANNGLAGDAHSPVISAVALSPSTDYAIVGDTVVISFDASEPVTPVSCSVNSVPLGANVEFYSSHPTYNINYTISEGDDSWYAGELAVNCVLKDAAGNSATLTALPANTLAGNSNSISITGVAITPATGTAKIGSDVVVSFNSSKLLSMVQCTINGVVITSFKDRFPSYEVSYTVTEGDYDWTSGALPFDCMFSDMMGMTVSIALPANTLAGDAARPTIHSVILTPSTGTARVGSTVRVDFSSTSAVTISSCSINGKTVSYLDGSFPNYSIIYTVAEGDSNWLAGKLSLDCIVVEASGNTAQVTLPSSTLAGDANTPVISAVSINPVSGDAITGTVITVQFSSSEPVTIQSCVINTHTITTLQTSSMLTYNITYVVQDGDPSWRAGELPFSCSIKDDAGNQASITLPPNTLGGNSNAPSFTSISIYPSTGIAKIGTSIIISFKSSEPVTLDSCLINGVNITTMSANSPFDADTPYELNYTVAANDPDWSAGQLQVNCVFVNNFGAYTGLYTNQMPVHTLAGDAHVPVFSSVAISPSTGYARVGSTVAITFSASESVTVVSCNVNSIVTLPASNLAATGISGQLVQYKLSYTVAENDPSWSSGQFAVSCVFSDAAGNTRAFNTVPGNTLIGDAITPSLSSVTMSPTFGFAKINSTITIGFTASEPVSIASCSINSKSISVLDGTFPNYSISYVVASGDQDWAANQLAVDCKLKDVAGNVRQLTKADLPTNTLAGDANIPSLSAFAISPSSGFVKVGQTVSVSFRSSEYISMVSCTVNSAVSLPVTSLAVSDAATLTFVVMYTVRNNDPDWAAGVYSLACTIQDNAGNQNSFTKASIPANTLQGDAHNPTLSGLSLIPDTGYAKVNDTVVLSFVSTEELTLGACKINNRIITTLEGGSPFTPSTKYFLSYTVVLGDSDWNAGLIPFDCTVADNAGNTRTITTASLPSNTLRGDANRPVLSAVTLSPLTGYVKVGSSVTVSFVSSEGLRMQSCVANGVTLGPSNFAAVSIVAGSTVTPPNKGYAIIYTLAEGHSDWAGGQFTINCVFSDDAGNTQTLTTNDLPANTMQGDSNSPVFSNFNLAPASGFAKIGSTINFSFLANEPVTVVSCTMNGKTATISGNSPFSASTPYTLSYVVASGDLDWAAGQLSISCTLADNAGNTNKITSANMPVNTLRGDANIPSFSSFAITPSTGIAKIGTSVVVTFTSSESIRMLSCTANSVSLPSTSFAVSNSNNVTLPAKSYAITYVVAEGDNSWDPQSGCAFNCVFSDDAGNTKALIPSDIPSNSLYGDATRPVLSSFAMTPASGYVKIGDSVTIQFSSTEFASPVACMVNNKNVSSTWTGGLPWPSPYYVTYTLAAGDADWASGQLPINCVVADIAGNTKTFTSTNFIGTNTLRGDANAPVFSSVQLTPSTGYAKIGSSVVVSFVSSETVRMLSCKANGVSLSSSNLIVTATAPPSKTYQLTYTVAEGNANWGSGSFAIDCQFQDDAGNAIVLTSLPSNTLQGDANAPALSAFTITPASGYAKVGTTVTIGFTSSETITLGACSINGRSVTDLVQNIGLSYSLSYTVAAGDADWLAGKLPISCVVLDAAQNARTITPADLPANTLVGDANAPVISAVALSPFTGTVKIGSSVTVSFKASEYVVQQSCTVNGAIALPASSLSVSNNATAGGIGSLIPYSIRYTVAAGDPSWASGDFAISCVLSDKAGNSITLDTLPLNVMAGIASAPVLSNFVLTPDSGYVKIGSVVTLSFVSNSSLSLVAGACFINRQSITTLGSSSQDLDGYTQYTYTLSYTLRAGHTDWSAGSLSVNCQLKDTAGNTASIGFANLPPNTLIGDANAPTITSVSVSPSSGYAGIGSPVVVSFIASENIAMVVAGTCTVNDAVSLSASSLSVSQNQAGVAAPAKRMTLTYTVAQGDPDWASGGFKVSCQFQDNAGNQVTLTPESLAANTLVGDAHPPVISEISISPSSGYVQLGDSVIIRFASSKQLTATKLKVNGRSALFSESSASSSSSFITAAASASASASYSYAINYTLASGDASWAAGQLRVDCTFEDAAGNTVSLTSDDMPANGLTGSASPLSISSVTMSPSSGYAMIGTSISIGFTASRFVTIASCIINGNNITAYKNILSSYTIQYVVAEGDADWAAGQLPVSCKVVDETGAMAQIVLPPNTLAGDANPPVISGKTLTATSHDDDSNNNNNNNNNWARIGSEVHFSFTSSKALTVVGQPFMNGKPVNLQGTPDSYSFVYVVGEGDPEWSPGKLPFSARLKDVAGNLVDLTLPDNALAGDTHEPYVSGHGLTHEYTAKEGTVSEGDRFTFFVKTNETGVILSSPTCKINNIESAATAAAVNGGTQYNFTYVYREGDAEIRNSEAMITVDCTLADPAGNSIRISTSSSFITYPAPVQQVDVKAVESKATAVSVVVTIIIMIVIIVLLVLLVLAALLLKFRHRIPVDKLPATPAALKLGSGAVGIGSSSGSGKNKNKKKKNVGGMLNTTVPTMTDADW